MSKAAPLNFGLNLYSAYSDSRYHGATGPNRGAKLARVTPPGGGWISKSQDGLRCAVAGKESLRIARITPPDHPPHEYHKSAPGPGGFRIESSRNLWEGSGLKVDSTSTDVAWGRGAASNKIITSARNGELIFWDTEKSGPTMYERRTKDHTRAINQIAISPVVPYYCATASADGDMRIWDTRDTSKSILRIHHPTSVRSVVFSPCISHPLQTVVGLDNGSIHRWDLKMGARGQLDRILLAHVAPVTALNWCANSTTQAGVLSGAPESSGNPLGWLATGGLDRLVQVWDLNGTPHIPHKPAYDLHPSFPVRRLEWRPSYSCELAIISNTGGTIASDQAFVDNSVMPIVRPHLNAVRDGRGGAISQQGSSRRERPPLDLTPNDYLENSDPIEIWDVRRGYIAKWRVTGSGMAGGVSDMLFSDSHAIWAQHASGSFSQFDLRESVRCVDAVPRMSASWNVHGSLSFTSDRPVDGEVPYDDIAPSDLVDGQIPLKSLGDRAYIPTSQTLGTFQDDSDTSTFAELAMSYVLLGADRSSICKVNAAEAFSVGRIMDGQAWLLLGVTLEDICLPPSEGRDNSFSMPAVEKTGTSHPVVPAPPSLADYTFPPSGSMPVLPRRSPLHKATLSLDGGGLLPPPSASRSARTPHSSNSPSPIHLPSPLPILDDRRLSHDATPSMLRRPSTYRRPSLHRLESPFPRPSSSDRHVGEGALDDSDSSDNEDALEGGSSDEEPMLRPLISPALGPIRIGAVKPSLLSRLVKGQQQWTEDEEGSSSDPSPQSTETDSDGPTSPRKHHKSTSRTRRPVRMKSRSRSSTIFAAGPSFRDTSNNLIRQPSASSVRTVIANTTPAKGESLDRDETLKPQSLARYNSRPRNWPRPSVVSVTQRGAIDKGKQLHREATHRPAEAVGADESTFRKISLIALRNALDSFADQGNVQICAMFAIIARTELGLSERQVQRYVEAYLEFLTRSRLHLCAAYVRKLCGVKALQDFTSAETIIYALCSRCRRPLTNTAGLNAEELLPRGNFSYCPSCRQLSKCAICHLPVKALLFNCSVCGHGGHQSCYRQYYMCRPLSEIPRAYSESVQRSSEDSAEPAQQPTDTRAASSEGQPKRPFLGHKCAAGCGHYCWAVFEDKVTAQ